MRFLVVKKSGIIKTAVIAVLVALLISAVSITGAAAVYGGKTTRKLPIYSVETEEKKVAISFDASWGADKTQSILDTLTRYDVCANYFVVSFWAEKYPEQLKALADSGRVEIGTHSNTHPHMPKLSRNQIELELSSSVKIIENVTGKKVELFRPPFGDYSDTVLEEAEKLGLYTIQWDVDSLDWSYKNRQRVVNKVCEEVEDGDIILMHDIFQSSEEAALEIIDRLQAEGWQFVTVEEVMID